MREIEYQIIGSAVDYNGERMSLDDFIEMLRKTLESLNVLECRCDDYETD